MHANDSQMSIFVRDERKGSEAVMQSLLRAGVVLMTLVAVDAFHLSSSNYAASPTRKAATPMMGPFDVSSRIMRVSCASFLF